MRQPSFGLVFITLTALLVLADCFARGEPPLSGHEAHHYTAYEHDIHRSASMFHANFNHHEFEKNKALIANDLHVVSNGAEFNGADEYVARIARFVGPFPDVAITDLETVVDGNVASIRFVVTGTHRGDFMGPEGVMHPTNKKIRIDGIEYLTFDKEGKLVDLLTVEDLAGLYRQIKD